MSFPTRAFLAIAGSILLILAGQPASAADRYDPGVPSPAEFLGFEIGDRPTYSGEILRYFEAVAAASPRATLHTYAHSHEGRPLVYLIVSSEANHARMGEIRADIGKIADPRLKVNAEALIETTPAVAYCAYSIHGDELSGCEAALRLAHELTAGESDEIKAIRENLVVLLDPNENPDGRERVLAMGAAFRGALPNPDPDALSHSGFWPWGRANHYLFDLNRDWFAQVHPESKGRAKILGQWRPQLVVDAHEMGSGNTYLFSPPRDPYNPNWPSGTLPWWQLFAADQAEAFDQRGWSYYTRDWNEEFFPGYGSALAIYAGAVGILYEQAGTRGEPVRQASGRVLSYAESVDHQYVSSLANLGTAVKYRAELLRAYRAARMEAIERGRKEAVRAYYFSPEPDAVRAERLAAGLNALGIEVDRLEANATLRGARNLWADGAADAELPAGSFRVRLDQPDGLLARGILEPHTLMADSSLAMEREHLERRKGSRIYDTTAWSPLLASGLNVLWTDRADKLDWHPWAEAAPQPGGLLAGKARYGWLFDGSPDAAPVLAAKLSAAGFKVRAGDRPFTMEGRSYPRGSFLLRLEENPDADDAVLNEFAIEAGIELAPVASARILEGPDLGGGHWRLLAEPRIAIAAGSPLNFTSVGAAWHLLDKEAGLRVSLVDIGRLGEIDLARYNTLVLPQVWGGGARYRRALGEGGLSALRDWVEHGGTLVALATAAEFLADSATELSQVRLRGQSLEDFPAPRFGLDDAAIRVLEKMQGTGLAADGSATTSAGIYRWKESPEVLGIPGQGSPLMGPGVWAMHGKAGEAARKRGAPKPVTVESKENGKPGPTLSPEETAAARDKADRRLRRFLPSGAILRVDLDPEHWLAFGAGERVAVLAGRRDALLARDPVSTVGRYAAPEILHLGGVLWPEAAGRISQTAYLTREGMGRGQMILFAGDPNFRGYFWGTERLFLNAVLLGPGMGVRQGVPW